MHFKYFFKTSKYKTQKLKKQCYLEILNVRIYTQDILRDKNRKIKYIHSCIFLLVLKLIE